MDDFDRTLLETFQRILPTLTPEQLQTRLARSRTATFTRHPRAWCLAVRASDTRINDATAILIPHRPTDPYPVPHQVVLDAPLLQTLCTAVELIPLSEWTDVAKALGVHPESLRYRMNNGHLRVTHYKGLGGKRGKPVPCFLNSDTLDPSAGRLHQPADPIWGCMWRQAAQRIPQDLSQTVTRTPAFASYQGQPRFRGWRWLCPNCNKKVRTLFYPLPPYRLQTLIGHPPGTEPENVPHSSFITPHSALARTFACHTCHHIQYHSSLSRNTWNHFITHITAGLLYGHEVPPPAWHKKTRKRPYRPALLREPSKRRQQVRDLLLAGQSYDQIATTLKVGYATVHGHIKRLYKQYAVHSRKELRARLQLTSPRTENLPDCANGESGRVDPV